MNHIRWLIRRDMAEVLAIEADGFANPWPEAEFIRHLRTRNCIGMIAESSQGAVVGFMIYELHKTRLRLLNFAVAASARRTGVGSQMLQRLQEKLRYGKRSRIILEVGESNLGAQLFFRANGFRCVAILKDFYEDTGDDAYLMHYRKPLEHEASHDRSIAAK